MDFSAFSNPQALAVVWLVVAILAVVIEGLTFQMTSIWFALGAACAAISAVLGADFSIQCIVFFGVSALALLISRPLVKKKLQVKSQSTNADRVIGQVGVVTVPIDNDLATGRIQVLGMDWAARAADPRPIASGLKVTVLAIDGVKLIVTPIDPPNTEAEL